MINSKNQLDLFHCVLYRMNKHLYNTYNNKIVPGVVNPIRRDNTYTNIHFNSKYRDNYYNSSASNFQYTLPQPMDNVVSVKLSSISIPNTWYVFSHELKNNRFIVEISGGCFDFSVHEIVIPDGNYDDCMLETFLNNNYFYNSGNENALKYVKFSILDNSLKSVFELVNTAPDDMIMNVKFVDNDTENIMYSAGWILGFRYGKYMNVEKSLMSEGLYDAGGDRYLYFCLNDFNRNSANHNIVYFDESMMKDDVMAKVYLKDGKFAVNVDDSGDDGNNNVKLRRYFGPVHLKKIHVKLIDQYGRQINLNNMDYSFSLEVEHKYKD